MITSPGSFEDAVQAFVSETIHLLRATLAGSPDTDADVFDDGCRAIVRGSHPVSLRDSESQRLVLRVEYLLRANDAYQVDIERSSFKIEFRAAKKHVPIVRFEYEAHAREKPASHFQFHADSVPLGLLLARARRYDAAAQQQDVHFPLGGPYFRVQLSDMIDLLIREFGALTVDGWDEALSWYRMKSHEAEVKRVISQNLTVAAEVLGSEGYSVIAPS